MWQQNYTPLADSLAVSAFAAAIPLFVLLILLGIFRKPAWIAGLSGLAAGIVVAVGVYGMPVNLMIGSVTFGAAFGLLPIGWIVYWAIVLYRIVLETGKFEIIKDSVGSLASDRRLQALLIAFAFGAFIEGAAGFGTPVAVAAAMLAGLGFSPFYAAGICLLANTAPVAFGSIGIPVITLAGITGLSQLDLSANVGRICAPVSFIVPAYLVVVMGGWRALRGVLPAAFVCGAGFAGVQFYVSNYLGPQLTDITSSLTAIIGLVVLFWLWKPGDTFELPGAAKGHQVKKHPFNEVILAWSPYLLLVIIVFFWGQDGVKVILNKVTQSIQWPMLHNLVERVPPVVGKPAPYGAVYAFNWLSASGTACLIATILSAFVLRIGVAHYLRILVNSGKQLALSLVTIAAVLGLAYLLNYCGATGTLGLAFAATGVLFPFFSAMLGWMGVFLTGSDTSANALFGNLQVVTANKLGLNPLLMAASNSAGGVMGKMISLQSIAVAAAATGMPSADEAKLFRFTLKHSILLAAVIGFVVTGYAYVFPQWAR
ncbi:MAG: lactate permease LctP family transporter [Acidobacteria bacterium]|nr:lactate permease LctP family transporter [Acidobacteriota bacterium]